MPVLRREDERSVNALESALDTLHLGSHGFWPGFLPEFNRVLRAEMPLEYGVHASATGPRVTSFHGLSSAELRAGAQRLVDGFLVQRGGFGLYQALRVERRQRNRAVVLRDLTDRPRDAARAGGLHRFGLECHDQVRVLISEGETLLAWVGAFRPDDAPFTAREKRILQRLVPALGRRIRIQAELESAPLAGAALDAALDALGRMAVLVDASGRVRHENALANARRCLDVKAFDESVRWALLGDTSRWESRVVVSSGLLNHTLLIAKRSAVTGEASLSALAQSWQLTPREREVLALVAEGLGNRVIAARLSCGERTVEVHVGRLLAKSETVSRSELVARVWREG